VQGTVLFKVTAVSGNPEMAKKLADAAIRATSEEANRLETLRMNGQSSAIRSSASCRSTRPSSPVPRSRRTGSAT
jgi:hypothetical protein